MGNRGRPPSKKPKAVEAKTRITEDESLMLQFCCEVFGISKSDVLRMGIKKVYDEAMRKRFPGSKRK